MNNLTNNTKLVLYIKLYLFIITFILISFQPTTVSANVYIGRVTHRFNDDTNRDISLTYTSGISSVISESKAAANALVSTAESAKHYSITLPSPGYDNLVVSRVGNLSASGVSFSSFRECRTEKVSNTQWRVWFCAMPNSVNGYTRSFDISGTVSANVYIGSVTHEFNDDINRDISLTYTAGISSVTSMSKAAPNKLVSTADSAKHYSITLPSPGYDSLAVERVGTNLSASGVSYSYLRECRIQKVSNTQWKLWFCAMPNSENGYTRLFNISGVAISGSISASPSRVSIPQGATLGTTNITWSTTGSTANVYVSCNSGPENSFGSGKSVTAAAPWIGVGSNCIFSLKSPDGTVLSSVTVTGVRTTPVQVTPVSGTISASPSTVIIPPGSTQGPTTITWSTTGLDTANIYVACNSGSESLFASRNTGTAAAPWIGVGSNCVFRLKSPTGTLLSSVTVTGVQVSGTISASPSTVIIPQGSTQGPTTITWSTTGLDTANIYVACNSGSESLFASRNTGTAAAPWIGVGSNCVFRLKSPTGTLLSSVTVTGVEAPNQAPTATYDETDNISYNTAIAHWEYSDPDGDPQTDIEVKVYANSDYSTGQKFTGVGEGDSIRSLNITGLTAGTRYYPKVRVRDSRESWSNWSNGVSFVTSNYPVPQVTYSISKSGDARTDKTNGQTLVLETGDSVNANWSITNTLGLQSCALSTTGGTNLTGEQAFRESLVGTGFSSNVNNKKVPNVTQPVFTSNTTYEVNLICTGKPAGAVRTVNQKINLTVDLNQSQTVNLTSVARTSTDPAKYTTAVINWTYTDPENDPQTKAEIEISTDNSFPNNTSITKKYVSNGTETSYTRGELLPGELYYVRVRSENVLNGWSEWTSSRSITLPDYPEPRVNYSLNQTGDIDTALQKGRTLTLDTGDSVSANWNITNTVGVVDNSCKISSLNTIGGDNTEIYNKTGLGFVEDNVLGNKLPVSLSDQTYAVKLECEGKPAKAPNQRNISAIVNLKIESYPTVRCSVVGSKTVKAGDADRNIIANIGNVAGYSWEAGVNNNDRDKNKKSGSNSTNRLTIPLTYSGTEFGRYTPWIKITRQGASPLREASDTCESITNLGDSNIREVR